MIYRKSISSFCTDCISTEVYDPPPPNEWLVYDIKQSDGEAPALEIWNTSSLPLLPGSLWSGVVATDSILSMGQIQQTMNANK